MKIFCFTNWNLPAPGTSIGRRFTRPVIAMMTISPEQNIRAACSRPGITPDTTCMFTGDKATWWALATRCGVSVCVSREESENSNGGSGHNGRHRNNRNHDTRIPKYPETIIRCRRSTQDQLRTHGKQRRGRQGDVSELLCSNELSVFPKGLPRAANVNQCGSTGEYKGGDIEKERV